MSIEPRVPFCYLICVVLLNLLLSLGFLIFLALVLSLISRVNSLTRQANRLLLVLNKAEEAENSLSTGSPVQKSPKTQ
jgi:hypothetical protein